MSNYKKILKDAEREYFVNGGSLYKYVSAIKEYIFSYPDGISDDKKKQLTDKAVRCIDKGTELPDGVQLKKVIILDTD